MFCCTHGSLILFSFLFLFLLSFSPYLFLESYLVVVVSGYGNVFGSSALLFHPHLLIRIGIPPLRRCS